MLAVAGDVRGGVWKAEVSERAVTCSDSVGISVGAGGRGAASSDVGRADSVDAEGSETVLVGC